MIENTARYGHVASNLLREVKGPLEYLAIEQGRSATLGGHVLQRDDCATAQVAYNSCRNRHCPQVSGQARQWLADRQAELLPIEYYRAVFTLPARIGDIAFQNPALVYDLLFKVTAATLRTIAADPKHLGANLRFKAVLHPWGRGAKKSAAEWAGFRREGRERRRSSRCWMRRRCI